MIKYLGSIFVSNQLYIIFFYLLIFFHSGEKDLMHTMTDHDRSRLQQLLMKAELDLEGLNFNDPIAVDQFMTTSREIRAQLAALKRYHTEKD